jgi:hypothetical protein
MPPRYFHLWGADYVVRAGGSAVCLEVNAFPNLDHGDPYRGATQVRTRAWPPGAHRLGPANLQFGQNLMQPWSKPEYDPWCGPRPCTVLPACPAAACRSWPHGRAQAAVRPFELAFRAEGFDRDLMRTPARPLAAQAPPRRSWGPRQSYRPWGFTLVLLNFSWDPRAVPQRARDRARRHARLRPRGRRPGRPERLARGRALLPRSRRRLVAGCVASVDTIQSCAFTNLLRGETESESRSKYN